MLFSIENGTYRFFDFNSSLLKLAHCSSNASLCTVSFDFFQSLLSFLHNLLLVRRLLLHHGWDSRK